MPIASPTAPLEAPAAAPAGAARAGDPTLCGLTPTEMHDRFWASRGVQVVRPGTRSEIVRDAELFLLMDAELLAIFRLRLLVEQLNWLKPAVLWVKLQDRRERPYREHARTDAQGRLVGFVRDYGGADSRLGRVALTPDRELAFRWQSAPDGRTAWRRLREEVPPVYRGVARTPGLAYDRRSPQEVVQFLRDLVVRWKTPGTTLDRMRRQGRGVWLDQDARLPAQTQVIGSVWIGAGRTVPADATLVGPTVLWDDPAARPQAQGIRWDELEPSEWFNRPLRPSVRGSWHRRIKRGLDLVLGALLLLPALPLFPLIMLAVYLEDGRPFFFGHERETLGGRTFTCWKFRSMRKDAEAVKQQLEQQNKADGPQFYIEHDPRVTRVGWVLRKYYLDELPQLLNVLAGHMSLVGPRPSPRRENQFCPAWREARLSVRPGLTGLWQVRRSRIAGLDFQEWIKYDIEYVERQGLGLDLWILWRTVLLLLRVR